MGLIFEILKSLGDTETPKDKKKQIDDKLFEDECKAYGLTEKEKEECRKSGITPEEWVNQK
jgi:hypothetical protein